jgi:gas vesicle protein
MSKNGGKWAVGALIAGGVGYLAGILTAPKSGRETRADIKNAAIKARTEAEKQLKSLHSELSVLLTQASKKAASLTKKGKEEAAVLISKGQNAKDKARDLLSAIHEGDANDPDLKAAIKEVSDAIKHLKAYFKEG